MSRRRALILLVMVAAFVAMPARRVAAHAVLVDSVPAANSVVATAPPAIVLTYDEQIDPATASITLFDAKQQRVSIGAAQQGDAPTKVTAALPSLPDGLYAVVWRVTSADGHVVDGGFSFEVGTASSGGGNELVQQVSQGAKASAAVGWWYGVARFLALGGAVVVLGVGGWGLKGDTRPRTRPAMWVGGVALLVGALACYGLFAATVHAGTVADAFKPSVWGVVDGTHTGRVLTARIAAAVGVLLLVSDWSRRATAWWRAAAALAAIVVLFTFSASGHPNSLHPRWLWIGLDMLHLIAIVAWVGGLLALVLAGRGWFDEPRSVLVVKRFSAVALLAVPLIVVTGLLQAWKLAGRLHDLTATTWGGLLFGKVMLFVVIVAIAGVSRRLLQQSGAGPIRRTVMAEAVAGLAVVALAAAMVGEAPRVAPPSRVFDQQLVSSGVIAAVTVAPGRVGSNDVHIFVTPPGGSIAPVAGVSGRVLLPSASIPESPVTLHQEGPNHYAGSVTFPRSGEWTLELVVQVTASDTVLVKGTVTVP